MSAHFILKFRGQGVRVVGSGQRTSHRLRTRYQQLKGIAR